MTATFHFRTILLGIPLALLMTACGGESGGDADASMGKEFKPDPATGATLTGIVKFEGSPPPRVDVSTESDPVCASDAGALSDEVTQEVVVREGRLANVFVYVSSGLDGYVAPPEKPVVIDQKGCRYSPHVAGVVVGQKVEFHNSDATLHNVHSLSKANPPFNIAQANLGKVDTKVFKTPEVMIPIVCDVHGWMKSYVGVMPHPFFYVTLADGAFRIPALPPGTYMIAAWHEKYGTKTVRVTVASKETKEIGFTFNDAPPEA